MQGTVALRHVYIFQCSDRNFRILWITEEIPFVQCFSIGTEREHQQWCFSDFEKEVKR